MAGLPHDVRNFTDHATQVEQTGEAVLVLNQEVS